jgi:hypothetical protein
MSCHGKTNYAANGELKDWRVFRERTIELARAKGDEGFDRYVAGVSDKAWEHILEENFFTPENAVSRLWNFYQSDVVAFKQSQQ